MTNFDIIINQIKFNDAGLVPVITQQYDTLEVLMLAWMNKEAIIETLKTNKVCYYSRSRKKLWTKGESSGQFQQLKEFIIDCDDDTILIKVDQTGVACHTGRRNCFYKKVSHNNIVVNQNVIVQPDKLYDKE